MTRLALSTLILCTALAPLAAAAIPEGGGELLLSGSVLSGISVMLTLPGDKSALLLMTQARPETAAKSR